MKIKRVLLIQHLQRVICGGQITEAVFEGTFGTTALTPSHQLLVIAPRLPKPKTALFKEPVGIAELSKLVKALGVLAGEGNEALDVNVKIEKHRLVVDEEHRGILRLMTAAPKTIGTHIEAAVQKKLMLKAPKMDAGIPLTRELVEGIRSTFALFKAAEIELFVGPKGGRLQVGGDNADQAEFASEDLKAATEYSLLFGSYLVDVLGVVSNFNEAVLCLGGPGNFVMVVDGGYKYLLAPQSRSKDEE